MLDPLYQIASENYSMAFFYYTVPDTKLLKLMKSSGEGFANFAEVKAFPQHHTICNLFHLSTELFLKHMLNKNGVAFPFTHELLKLFNLLNDSQKTKLNKKFQAVVKAEGADLTALGITTINDAIALYSDDQINMRYAEVPFYEIFGLQLLAKTFFDFCDGVIL